MPWYMEAQAEYLIRHLSDEFFIEVADVPYPPYENFLDRFPETYPFQRSPDDYDLIVPLLATHWVVTEREKYRHKIGQIWYQPNEGDADNIAVIGATTPMAQESLRGRDFVSLRFGVDINHFRPLNMAKEDELLHVGMVGNLYNPRRMVPEVIKALKDLEGVRLMLFLGKRPLTLHDMDFLGGMEALKYIVAGEKDWAGLPNIYNRLDVLVRCDSDPGYSFPVLEAAACGVPVIATNSGIDHLITQAGGGLLIGGDRNYYLNNPTEVGRKVRDAVIFMRDNPRERRKMASDALTEIMYHWKWDNFEENWRKFFRIGIKNARRKN